MWNAYLFADKSQTDVTSDPRLPLCSIITPSYNQGEYIGETIQSVLSIDYPNFEYWVIDGGSSDDTLSILRKYESDPRFHWLSELDGGQSDAINKGFVRCRGDIWTWINSDDLLLPHSVLEAVEFFKSHPSIDIMYGDLEFIECNGTEIRKITGDSFDLHRLVTDRMKIPQPGFFMRCRSMKKLGPLRSDLHYALDTELWVRAALHGSNLAYFPGIRAKMRLHPESKTTTSPPEFIREERMILELYFSKEAQVNLPRSWQKSAYINNSIYYGIKLMEGGDKRRARKQFLQAMFKRPIHRRNILVLSLIFDSFSGLHVWNRIVDIKRKLERIARKK